MDRNSVHNLQCTSLILNLKRGVKIIVVSFIKVVFALVTLLFMKH